MDFYYYKFYLKNIPIKFKFIEMTKAINEFNC